MIVRNILNGLELGEYASVQFVKYLKKVKEKSIMWAHDHFIYRDKSKKSSVSIMTFMHLDFLQKRTFPILKGLNIEGMRFFLIRN